MDIIHSTSLFTASDGDGKYRLEVRSYGRGLATPLVVEYYDSLSWAEVEQTVEATLYTLRPGVGYFSAGPGYQPGLEL